VQSSLQHTPSAQKFDAHWFAAVQVVPGGPFDVHWPPAAQ
jgi:hypothetical protein